MFPAVAAQKLRDEFGHDAVHVSEVGLAGVADAEVANTARGEKRAVVTENVADFAAEPDATTFVDCSAAEVVSAELNGREVPGDAIGAHRIALHGLRERNEVRVVAEMAYRAGEHGITRFTDPVDDAVYVFSDCEPFGAHRAASRVTPAPVPAGDDAGAARGGVLRSRSDAPHVVLRVLTNREDQPPKLLLPERVQHVGLILVRVRCTEQAVTVRAVGDAGIVAGGEKVGVQRPGMVQ